MAKNKGAGFRLDLGEPWSAQLKAFCAAYYDASQTQVIREALDHYIPWILDQEPIRKKRYQENLEKSQPKKPKQ